ncbi:MAG: hypothetical protein M0C28_32270 [Candidatus Moduliflexus flocculans]|nr:hypothetical protein [Candidatus Moduliflexus flocculans]
MSASGELRLALAHPRPEEQKATARIPRYAAWRAEVGPFVRLEELPPGLPAPGSFHARHRPAGHPRQHRSLG